MKRQKLDRLENSPIHVVIRQALLDAHSKEMCPYQMIDAKSIWLGGWRQAMEDRSVAA